MRFLTSLLLGSAAITSCLATDYEELYNVQTRYHEPNRVERTIPRINEPFDFTKALQTNLSNIPEAPITWIGAAHLGGPNISITGSHHFVKAKLKELDAYWLNQNGTGVLRRDRETLEKRWYRTSFACNQPIYAQGQCSAVMFADYYIQQHYGGGTCIAGPYACGRFACSYNTATLLCAGGPRQVAIPCSEFSTNVDFLYNACFAKGISGSALPITCRAEGQAFYTQPNYNVLIKGTDAGRGC